LDYDGEVMTNTYVIDIEVHVMSVVGLNERTMNIWWPKCELLATTWQANANTVVLQTADFSHNPSKQ